MGKGGVFLTLDQFYSWKNSLCAQTSVFDFEREMCPWAISKCFGDLVSNTSA
jgi:hypothetical protein